MSQQLNFNWTWENVFFLTFCLHSQGGSFGEGEIAGVFSRHKHVIMDGFGRGVTHPHLSGDDPVQGTYEVDVGSGDVVGQAVEQVRD